MSSPFLPKLSKYLLVVHLTCFACVNAEVERVSITLDEAICRTFMVSPQLKVSEAEVQIEEGDLTQAGLYPNPVIGYSVENVLGNKSWRGWKSAESRYEIAQLIELGCKRSNRIAASRYEVYAALAGYEASKLSLLNSLTKAIVDIAAAQERYQLAANKKEMGEQMLSTISAKASAGKVSMIQQKNAEIALLDLDVELESSLLALESSREALSLFWGRCQPDFDWVDFDFFALECPQNCSTYIQGLTSNPELLQSQFEYLSAQHNFKLEKSNAIPDLIVTLGYKTEQKEHHSGMIIGAEIPLPIFNQNQGNIGRACGEINRTREAYAQLHFILESRLTHAHRELTKAYHIANQLQTKVLQAAQQAFDYANDGYTEGKFEYIDLLIAQEKLYDIKEKLIDALQDYHQRRADIEYLNSTD